MHMNNTPGIRSLRRLTVAGLVGLAALLANPPAQAHGYGYWHGGGGWGYWHGGGWGWGGGCCWGGSHISFAFGFPAYYPYYANPYPYCPAYSYAPPYAYAPSYGYGSSYGYSSPQPSQPLPPQQQSWYYCDNPQGYYPYVQSCSHGWRQVPATPPGVNSSTSQ